MALISRYTTISPSTVYTDTLGNPYPDITTFPILDFQYVDIPQKYSLTLQDIQRFDVLITNYYGSSNYDDIVLWINNIEFISDVTPGTTIYLPSKKDLDDFYRENYK